MLNAGILATVVPRHFGCTRKTVECSRRRFRVTGNVADRPRSGRPLLPMIAVSSCSTYVTGVWLQQQPEDSMEFIHRLSEIGWYETFKLFVRTNRTSVKFSLDFIERQGGIGAAVTCPSDELIGIWFCFAMNVGLTLSSRRTRESLSPSGRAFCRCVSHWAGPFI